MKQETALPPYMSVGFPMIPALPGAEVFTMISLTLRVGVASYALFPIPKDFKLRAHCTALS